jgi:hypothetical protein
MKSFFSTKFEQIIPISITSWSELILFRLSGDFFAEWWSGPTSLDQQGQKNGHNIMNGTITGFVLLGNKDTERKSLA